jgi:hypothetical protein
MVTKTIRPAVRPALKRAAPRKPGQRATVAAKKRAVPLTEPASKPNLLRAGLKALGNVRDDVVQHQSRIFESLLGIDPKQSWPAIGRAAAGKAAQEAFGLRKFEAVFDQRVANAIERMGMPSAQALTALVDQVSELNKVLRRLEAAQRKR